MQDRRPPLMSELSAIIASSFVVGEDVPIGDLTLDSREVTPERMFCATKGARFDGMQFIQEAIARGASSLMVSQAFESPLPLLVVPSVRHAVGRISDLVFNSPSSLLDLVGITGTNGKTTTSYLMDSALQMGGHKTGLIGTIESRVGDSHRPSIYTTPEAPDLHRVLAEMVDLHVDIVAMEVSSHGIDQHRIDGAHFKLGIFTNLTAEHLDYHGTIEQYFYAKSLLFEPERCDLALVCIDDEWGRRLSYLTKVPVLTYGFSEDADLVIVDFETGFSGTRLHVKGLGLDRALEVPIIGSCNAANAAAAYLGATQLGVSQEDAAQGIAITPGVEGRFQRIDLGQDFLVVVDYAHTPDSIRALIRTARDLIPSNGRVILVAGARGRRDRMKRPELGRAAASADLAILTTDNPGDEDPAQIVRQLLAGTVDIARRHIEVELDRRVAIHLAIEEAGPDDAVLIVGRGHERSFRVGDARLELDDRQAASEAILSVLAKEGVSS